MRHWFLALAAASAGCSSPLLVEGAPCPCPGGYVCDAVQRRCVRAPISPQAMAPDAGTPVVDRGPACFPGPTPERWLDAEEYANTVRDLLGVEADVRELPRI